MKRLVCYLLIVWLTVMSGGASASAIGKVDQSTAYTHDHAAPEVHSNSNSAAPDPFAAADCGHSDACNHSHCGHHHAAGLLTRHGSAIKENIPSNAPTSTTSWASSGITSNIERPKWILTTPAVVNLLS